MDIEQYFISALLTTKDIQQCIDARITADYLQDEDHRRIYEFIHTHYQKYGQVPLISSIKRNYPTYSVIKVDHPLDYYTDEIRLSYLQERLTLTLADMQEALEERRPREAMQILQQELGGLSQIDTVMVDENFVETWEKRLEEYEELKANGGRLRGHSTGFPSIDRSIQGLQPEQFIVLVGLPKAGKSTILLVIAKNAHATAAKILLIGFEMTNQEQGARYDSIVAEIDHQRLLTGQITREDIAKLEEVGKQREGMRDFIASTDIASATTVSGIAAKIDQYKPTLVFIDGVYLMDDENGEPKGSSAALTNITRGIARLTKQKKVCIIGTTQVLASKVSRATGVTAASVGYSSSFAQDCHAMFSVEAVEDEPNIQKISTLLSRSGPQVTFEVDWDWSTGTFNEMEVEGDQD